MAAIATAIGHFPTRLSQSYFDKKDAFQFYCEKGKFGYHNMPLKALML